jgi:antitoxin component of RelBE/YafQ-DinJ toxin-antitoxin module
VSHAVCMLLVRVGRAEMALPFDVKDPDSATVKTLRAADKRNGKRLCSTGALFKNPGI